MFDLDNQIEAQHETNFQSLYRGESFKDLSTVIITAVRGERKESRVKDCPHCGQPVPYDMSISVGISPIVVDSWKRMPRPMNERVQDLMATGFEVGDAYEQMLGVILNHHEMQNYKYVMFIEDDIVVPVMKGTRGPLFRLYELMEKYDVANGLYWTKEIPPMPLVFGDPTLGTGNFEYLTNWKPGDVVECNGAGMGFTLMKMSLFKDPRLTRPFFKTWQEVEGGSLTQDLYFYKRIRELGYKVCVDTSIKCGHYDAHERKLY